jgi:tripartite-type tricarboxylate transporter receptor subunit TctC
LPTVPTVVEEGFPKLQAPFWLAVVAPVATPRDVIETLNHAFRDALAAPETVAKLKALGTDPKTGTPEDLGAMLASELAQWKGVVQAAHLKIQ